VADDHRARTIGGVEDVRTVLTSGRVSFVELLECSASSSPHSAGRTLADDMIECRFEPALATTRSSTCDPATSSPCLRPSVDPGRTGGGLALVSWTTDGAAVAVRRKSGGHPARSPRVPVL
jgi:hypothetical protein